MVELLEDFIWPDGKIGLQKICKNFANELQSLKRVMRGFQKGITLGGKTPGGVWWWWVVVGGGGRGGGGWPVAF